MTQDCRVYGEDDMFVVLEDVGYTVDEAVEHLEKIGFSHGESHLYIRSLPAIHDNNLPFGLQTLAKDTNEA